jgi:EcsC family protein
MTDHEEDGMPDITRASPVDAEAELDRLAARYRAAGGVGVNLLNMVGGKAENLLAKLPVQVREGLNGATEQALKTAMRAASTSRAAVPDQPSWINTAVATAMGAAGGMGGLPTALIELPATTTLLLRAIQGVAREYGFDPDAENVQFDCIRVFSAAGPLASDDGADLGFFATRITLSGGAMQKIIASVAPRLGAVLGQKLATQTVPVLGALTGATINMVYTGYYQQIAHVHFGLRKLSIDADIPHEQLVDRLQGKMRLAGE